MSATVITIPDPPPSVGERELTDVIDERVRDVGTAWWLRWAGRATDDLTRRRCVRVAAQIEAGGVWPSPRDVFDPATLR